MLGLILFNKTETTLKNEQFFYFFSFLLTEIAYSGSIIYCNISVTKKSLIYFCQRDKNRQILRNIDDLYKLEKNMQKKILTFASALLLSTVIAGTASARDGWYAAVRGGVTNSNMNSVDESSTTTAKADIDFDNVWMMSGAVGYRYSYFRAELEYSYREDHDETSATGLSGTEFGAKNLMLNGYFDFLPNYVISPYVSAGIGWAQLSLDTFSKAGGATTTNSVDSDNFTWSIGAGMTVRVNKCLNIDAGYRYLDMGDIENANVNAHEVYFGLRYTF